MLARERTYTLKSGGEVNVNVTVHPCCTIEIDIPELRQYIQPRLEQLHFKLTNHGMILAIDESEDGSEPYQELYFSRDDAMELCQMINEVVEEHEDLMSALF